MAARLAARARERLPRAGAPRRRDRDRADRGGRSLGSIAPGKNYYPAERSSSNEVAIRHSFLTLEDVYVIADQIDQKGGGVYFKVLVKPLVNLIWLAGFVFVFGSVITLWPDAREQRRLVARSYDVGIPATS